MTEYVFDQSASQRAEFGIVAKAVSVFRTFIGVLATIAWCSTALLLRPFWKRSVIVLQTYWARSILWIGGVKVYVEAFQKVDPPVVYVANHQSALDILVLIAWMPDSVRFVARKEIASIPFCGWCMRAADYVLINRSSRHEAHKSLVQAGAGIRNGGRSVIIFPEGTRSPRRVLGPFKPGAIRLALEAQTPIVPIGIQGTADLWERNAIVCRSGVVRILIGKPVDPQQWIGREQELLNSLRSEVSRLAQYG